MPEQEFFERIGPQFAEHAEMVRTNVERQADVELLIDKAEYECQQLRRELAGLIELGGEPRKEMHAQAQPVETPADAIAPAKAA